MNNDSRPTPKLRLGALWFRKTRNGREYTSGQMSRQALIKALESTPDENIDILLVFQNKTSERQPDAHIIASKIDYVPNEQRGIAGPIVFGGAKF